MGVITDRLDEQRNSLDNYSKPETRWTELSTPYETSNDKLTQLGIFGLGAISAVAALTRHQWQSRIAKDWQATATLIPPTVAIISIGVAVVWKGINWWQQRPLLQNRQQIGKEIEEKPLATLREQYPSSYVLSDQELNQWIRYLASKDPIDTFLEKQSARILDLPLDTHTKNLLKKKYQDFIRHPGNTISFRTLIHQPAFQTLLSEDEKSSLKRFVASREVEKLGTVDANVYEAFITKNSDKMLLYLDGNQLKRLAPGFQEWVLQKRIGILLLKNDHHVELKQFGEAVSVSLFRTIADREAYTETYEKFKTRNGVEAIDFITKPELKQKLSDSFVAYGVGQNLGLVETRHRFARELEKFGADAAVRIDTQIHQQEAIKLGKEITYDQFKERNGFDTIRKTCMGNAQWTAFFREHFLKMRAKDLCSPSYQDDRNLLQITALDLQITLRHRWSLMPLKDILATEGSGFSTSMQGSAPLFNPREWTQKAVLETQNLPVYDIITIYKELIKIGVLTAADGHIWQRLFAEISTMPSWEKLLDRYTTFIFDHRLTDARGVAALVNRFIETHAESFVNESFSKEFFNRYVEPLYKHSLLPQAITTKLTYLRDKRKLTIQLFNDWKTHRDQDYARTKKQTQDDAEERIASHERQADLPRKKREAIEAQENWQVKKTAHTKIVQAMREGEQAIDSLSKQVQQIQAQKLPPLVQDQQTLLMNDPRIHYPQAKAAADTASAVLQKAEAVIASDAELNDYKARVEKRENQLKELQQKLETIKKLKVELAELEKTVSDPSFAKKKQELEAQADVSKPENSQASVKKASEALQDMKNHEAQLADLKKLLAREDYQVTTIEKEKSQLETLLKPLNSLKNDRFNTLSQQLQLITKRANAELTAKNANAWKAALAKFESTYDEIERLKGLMLKLNGELAQKRAANEQRLRDYRILTQELDPALERKTRAETLYSTSSETLARQTADIRLECQNRLTELQRRYQFAIKEREDQKSDELKSLVTELKGHVHLVSSMQV